jgi:primosomal protein N' (replication factor Y)
MAYLRVAVDVPLPTLFDYRWDGRADAALGRLALVPFGRRQTIGVVLEVASKPAVAPERVKPALRLIEDIPPLSAEILDLLRFCSDYYHHPIGEVVHNALPQGLRAIRSSVRKQAAAFALAEAGEAALADGALRRAPALAALLERIANCQSVYLANLAAAERRHLKVLRDRGYVREWICPEAAREAPQSAVAPPPVLTQEQSAVLRAIAQSASGFRPWLLQGVTGSGKTEVYLRLVDSVLRGRGQVLLLVPEISLTPQLEERVRNRFPGHGIVMLHSGLSNEIRTRNWLAAQSGEAAIVLGTRSAVFVPMPQLQLIVVDEEHDASYKQLDAVRYCARDLAIWRARQRAIPVVLGSATPSLESFYAAQRGRYAVLRLTQRVTSHVHPRITLVPTTGERLIEGFAAALTRAIAERLRNDQQVLVFINRRGYSPVLYCSACTWTAGCPRCSARLVLHTTRPRLVCHHCGHAEAVAITCPQCGGLDLQPIGHGTQRIESALHRVFPQARLLRIDRDTTQGARHWPQMRRAIEDRQVDLLIGTQLLAKGHDFPALSLVCVLNADQSLYSTDFRASEQLFAQLMQVAGRAGRGEVPGDVLIQTAFPAHPLYQAVYAQSYEAFAQTLLSERRAAGFPPFVHQAMLRAESGKMAQTIAFLESAVRLGEGISEGVTIFDPAPAVMARLNGRERAQLLVQSSSRTRLHRFLDQWLTALRANAATSARWVIDVDPLEV